MTKSTITTTDQLLPDTGSQPGKMRRFASALWRTMRTLTVVGLIAALGYFGWPILNERVVAPIAENSATLQATESRLADAERTIETLGNRLQTLTDLEADVPDRLSALEGEFRVVEDDQQEMADRVDSFDIRIATHTTRLAVLDGVQDELFKMVADQDSEFRRELDLVRIMELLSRARLFLFEANYGLAASDIDAARLILLEVQAQSPGWESEMMAELLFRMDRSREAIPNRPVVAAGDLDIAWEVLLAGLPDVLPDDSSVETKTP